MTDLKTKLAALRESEEHHRADGPLLERIVAEHAVPDFPSWELARCWTWDTWPGRGDRGLPLGDDGIDLVAETTTGRSVAIQCKARSETGRVTPTDIQKFRGAAMNDFDEAWMVTTSQLGSGALEMLTRTNVVWKNVYDEASAAEPPPAADAADPRTAMQDAAVASCVRTLKKPQADLAEHWAEEARQAAAPGLTGVTPISRAKLILPCAAWTAA